MPPNVNVYISEYTKSLGGKEPKKFLPIQSNATLELFDFFMFVGQKVLAQAISIELFERVVYSTLPTWTF